MNCCGLSVAKAYANRGYPPYPSAADEAKLGAMDQQPPQGRPGAGAKGDVSRPKHDPGQKRLFSHRRMVADLLRLLPEGLAGSLDLKTLRRLPAEHVGDALRSRRSDMPWRIDLLPPREPLFAAGGATPFEAAGFQAEGAFPHDSISPSHSVPEHPGVCLLVIEFQSTVDPRMAERMQEYAAMLRGDLAREGRVRGPGGGPPPLLPLVVYNGRRPWTAPVDLGGGLGNLPARLADIQPKFEYMLLEVRCFDRDALALGLQEGASGVNFALAQFALENASAESLPEAMSAVARLLRAEGELDLAESFGMWVEGVLEPRLGVRLPSLARMMEEPPMLAETLDEWAEEKYRLGQTEGMERGRAEGLRRGVEQGRFEGRAEGMERERALLLRQARRRFGADVAEALSKLIEGVEDPDRLAEVGDLVVDCATGSDLLARAGRA